VEFDAVTEDSQQEQEPNPAGQSDRRAAVERALMDRFRDQANRPEEKAPQRIVQHGIALALAVGLVLIVLLGFDKFLTSMQKFMEVEIQDSPPAASAPQAPQAEQSIPAFVVPADVSPQQPAGPDPRPSQPQAPDNVPATR
jgi:hypothetical protein